jgi:hypothetical protein
VVNDSTAHAARIADILSRLDETAARFVSRLERAGDRGQQAASGWTAAQIAAHVAMVNDNFAAVIDGSGPGAVPPPDLFVERSWPDIVGQVPARNESPARFVPPVTTTIADAISHMRSSTARLRDAVSGLTPERSGLCITHRAVGTITLYQVGDFAIAHMIRHNHQAKRVLGE